MNKHEREIVAIVDAPLISLSDSDEAGKALILFYQGLGWNSNNEIIDPCKVRTTKAVFDRLYDVMYEKCPERIAVGMEMVNRGPGVDSDVPPGKVYLLKAWTAPFNPEEGDAEDAA